ncbi:autotransporter-associated beta strand repeat-containing protein [Mesorhizobium sp. YR577]|uniref:autotransporter-associated beta strand repeat-containing protein n=1 Tax=Mesorhizobium sp. YR577 TaxID=1884373 RepID=UPI0008E807A6|nr:autotransporter-associated beta strand repeat-containing protein [Mesorhizobium sp. YR577]SFU11553.1 autotransporter-associated beta strand repeat-containing protein [Mesorhizobium sp. YR577]
MSSIRRSRQDAAQNDSTQRLPTARKHNTEAPANSLHGRYRAILLAGTALVAPIALVAMNQPALAQFIGSNGGNGGNGGGNGTSAGGGGAGGNYGDGSAAAPGGGGGSTGGQGSRGGGGGGSDSGGGGGGGYITGAGGGGGGAGGAGMVLGTDLNNSNAITGGNGGNGGSGSYGFVPSGSYGGGGGGGGGGSGIIATTGANLINSGTITGGDGGGGGSVNGIYPYTNLSENGAGGRGGNGISAMGSAGLAITNTGTIKGGGGGTDFQNFQPYRPQPGGFGIIGQNLTIINSGTIAGGVQGGAGGSNGAVSTAIIITGGVNGIKALAGSNIGSIELGGNTTLAGTFNNTIQVNGGVTMSVSGSTTADDVSGITTLTNYGTTAIAAGRALSAQTINNSTGTISVGAGATLRGTGNTLNNNATINVDAGGNLIEAGAINNQGGGTINFSGPTGTATLSAGGGINNDGQIKVMGGDVSVTGNLSNQNNGTLTLTGGNMTGIGTLTNSGTATLNVASGYNLGVDTLSVTGGSVTGTGTITATTVFNIQSGTIATALAGSGAFNKIGSGTATLSSTNTYSGGTNINGGTLAVSTGANLGSGALSFNSGTLQATSSLTTSLDATLDTGGGTLSVSTGTTLTYNGLLSGAGALSVAGGGKVSLGGANTYLGGTTLIGGTLSVLNDSSLGDTAGTLTLQGGTLETRNSSVAMRDVVLNGTGGDLAQAAGATLIHSGQFTGIGALTVSGPGTLKLTNSANSYSGGTTLAGGTLEVTGDDTLGSGGLTFVGGALATTDSFTMNRAVTLSGAGTIASVEGTTLSYAGAINGVGGLTVAGGGTLALLATNGYQGGTTISADATLSVLSNDNLGASTGSLNFDGGTLSVGSSFNMSRSGTIGTGGGTVALNGTTLTSLAGFSGSGALTVEGTGTLVLAGANTHSGGTTITDATLQIGNGSASGSLAGAVTNDGKLVFDRTGTITLDGAIDGSGSLEQNGAGTAILTGSNSYSGGTRISDGTLQIGDGGNFGSLSGDVDNGGTLVFNRFNNSTFDGVVSGTGTVSKAGAGKLTLTGTNTYSGLTTISGGTLEVGDGATSGSLGRGDVSNGGTLAFNRSDIVTVNNEITGIGKLNQTGTGTTILTGTSTYTGATTVSAGTLLVNGSIASSSGITIDAGATIGGSGTLASTTVNGTFAAGNSPGTLTVDGDLVLNSGSTSVFELGTDGVAGGPTNDLVIVDGDLTLGGTLETPNAVTGYYRLFNVGGGITGSFDDLPTDAIISTAVANQVNLLLRNDGQLLQFWDGSDLTGNGTVDGGSGTWNAANGNWTGAPGEAGINDSWRGEVGVFAGTAGTVTLDGTLAFQGLQFSTDGYALSGGVLELKGDPHGNVDASFINTDAGVTATIASEFQASWREGLDKLGLGTLILTGDSSFIGKTTISSGILQLGDGGTTGSLYGDIVNNSVLKFDRSDDDLVLGGVISGTGSVEQAGTGTTTLTAENTYSGGTTISSGTLQLGDGGTSGSIAGDVVNNGTLALNRIDAELVLDGVISGTGALVQKGANGAATLTGNNTYTGGTTIEATSRLILGDGGTSGSIAGDVVNNGLLVFQRSDDVTFDGDISGNGALTKVGTNKLTLTGDSSYTGRTAVVAGTLRLESDTAAGASEIYLATNDSVLDYDAGIDVANDVTIAEDVGKLQVNSGTATQSGVIWGYLAGMEKLGAGTLVVKEVYVDNETKVSEGALKAGADNALSADSDHIIVSGAKLNLDGYDQTIASLAGAGDVSLGSGTLTTGGNNGSTIFSGRTTGTGGLTKYGTGIFTLSGTNSYTGATTIYAGTLKAGATNSFAAGSAFSIAESVKLDLGGYNQTIGSLTGTGEVALGAGSLTTGGNNTSTTYAGVIGGSGGLTKSGSGTFTLSGSSTYTGATKVDAGTLKAGAENTFAAGSAFSIASGTTLDFDGYDQIIGSLAGAGKVTLGAGTLSAGNASDTSFSGVISGGGSLIKQGAGSLTLTGINTYTGTTSVTAGRLQVDGRLAGTAVTVESSATLSGSGSIDGAVTVSDGGYLAPGSNHGPLTLGSLFLANGAYLDYELGLTSDRIDVVGDLTLDGTINVSGDNDFGAGIYRLFNYGGALTDNGLAIGTVPAAFQAGDLTVQTAVASQINLVNTGGTTLSFWDGGSAANLNNGTVDGGDGGWSATGGNWTKQDGAFNAPMTPQPGYAIFQGQAGTVTVDGSLGEIAVTGMQFASDGYRVEGDSITLADAATTIRVGDGTTSSTRTEATIASELTGAGTLVKDDHGTLTLTGNNSYTGGTVIKGGKLTVSSDVNLGAISGGLAFAGGTLRNAAAMTTARDIDMRSAGGTLETQADFTASGTISGQGKLTKSGIATLTLTGTNTYTGSTRIDAGTLQLGNGGTTGSIAGDVDNVGALAFNRSNLLTFAGSISGSGAVEQTGSGKTVLAGTNSYAGGTTIASGTLAGTASSFGTGAILNNAALVIDQSTDASFANAINGTGDFAKTGSGTLTLTGTSLLAGDTTVSAGRLAVNGSLTNSSVTVESGASLGGTGTVGKVTALSGSTVATGNSIGTLNVAGDARFATGSTFQVDVDDTGKSDRLAVSGRTTLSGGTVQVLAGSGNYGPSMQYTILTAASGIFGQFASVTTNLAFLTPTLSYIADSIGLKLDRNAISFADVALTRNQIATGGAAEKLGNQHALYKAIVNLDEDAARKALDALSGEVHASVNGMLAEDSNILANTANGRIRAAFGDTAITLPVMAYGPDGPVLGKATTDRLAVWGQAYGSWGNTHSDGNAAAFNSSTGGFLGGVDTGIGDNLRLGVIGGYSHSSFDAEARASSGSISAYQFGVFGGGQWGNLGLRGGAAYSWNNIETSRAVAFPGFSDSLNAQYDAGTTQVFGEVGYRLHAGGSTFEPFAGLNYVAVRTDGFSEKGGKAALTGSDSTSETTFATLGVRASADIIMQDFNATLHGMVGWRHAFGDFTSLSSLAFAGGSAFTIAGVPIARNSAIVEGGLDFALSPAAKFGLSYAGQFGNGAIDQSFKANLAVSF